MAQGVNKYLTDYSDMVNGQLYIGNTGKMAVSPAKKLKNVYHLLYSNENICKSQWTAQKGKGDRKEIQIFNSDFINNLQKLWEMLRYETFEPGEYKIRTIYEPKERVIMIAPFFPDRIIHHCVINVLGTHWCHIFIGNTYSCIKGRGIHKCMEAVHRDLTKDPKGTKYCLKIDIKKFYDNVDHAILKKILRYSIADEQILRLLDKIIDSNGKTVGLPIGNFTSQYLANLYLTYFDHWAKEVLRLKYYYRYMDDVVVLDADKGRLHKILDQFGLYLGAELHLEIKHNWQIFPVDDRSIDYVGYRQTHHQILLRKGILIRFYRKLNKTRKKYEIKDEEDFKHLFSSEYGWITRCSKGHSIYIIKNSTKNE